MTGLEVLQRELNLPYEWHLGSGGQSLYAPEEPTSLMQPGFRDDGWYAGHPVEPVFALALLDENGREISLKAESRSWTPARLELHYALPQGGYLVEQRAVLGWNAFVSRLAFLCPVPTVYNLMMWTRRPVDAGQKLTEWEANPQSLSWQETGSPPRVAETWNRGVAFGANVAADSWSVHAVAHDARGLTWHNSPLAESVTAWGLPGKLLGDQLPQGTTAVHIGLLLPLVIAPEERFALTCAAALGPDTDHARAALERTVRLPDPIIANEEDWIDYFEGVPSFCCSDPFVQRLYWYRWAMHRLWQAAAPRFFRECDPLEANLADWTLEGAWQHSEEAVLADLRALLACTSEQLALQPTAWACRQIMGLHPTRSLSQLVLDRLAAKSAKADKKRGASAVTSTLPRFVTLGYEEERAILERELRYWQMPMPTVHWIKEQTKRQLQRQSQLLSFWNDDQQFFMDESRPETAGKTAWGFLPSQYVFPDRDHLFYLYDHLADAGAFWSRAPIPSVSRDGGGTQHSVSHEETLVAVPNEGAAWPALTSQVLDALWVPHLRGASMLGLPPPVLDVLEAKLAEEGMGLDIILPPPKTTALVLSEYLCRYIKLCFVSELSQPAFFTRYDAVTGRPCFRAGRARPPAGRLLDHVLRLVAGITPQLRNVSFGQMILIHPLPLSLEWFAVERLMIGSHELSIAYDCRNGLRVTVDGSENYTAPVGYPLLVPLEAPPQP